MKIISVLIILTIVNLHANDKWIKIEPITDTKEHKTKTDLNLSQSEPMRKIMKNISLIQNIIKVANKKETKKQTTNKNWFVIQEETK